MNFLFLFILVLTKASAVGDQKIDLFRMSSRYNEIKFKVRENNLSIYSACMNNYLENPAIKEIEKNLEAVPISDRGFFIEILWMYADYADEKCTQKSFIVIFVKILFVCFTIGGVYITIRNRFSGFNSATWSRLELVLFNVFPSQNWLKC